jgi:hypothetical protein
LVSSWGFKEEETDRLSRNFDKKYLYLQRNNPEGAVLSYFAAATLPEIRTSIKVIYAADF